MAERFITLPARDEMLKRLVSVFNDDQVCQHLYPKLLMRAEQKLLVDGIVHMLSSAIKEYVSDKPEFFLPYMYRFVPRFIDALVDEPEVAQTAKSVFSEIQRFGRRI